MAKTATAANKTKAKSTAKKASKTVAAKAAPVTKTKLTSGRKLKLNWDFTPSALLAEFFGSMLLVTAILVYGNPLYTGFALIALAAVFAGISGVNFNPAVSFGLWAMRKMSTMRMLAYWLAQFVGALAATLLLHVFSGEKLGLSLSSFTAFDGKVFGLEFVGMTVFMFAFAAAWAMRDALPRATTMGLGLFIGLVAATGLLAYATQGASATLSATDSEAPRISKIGGATLNPAAALVMTETDQSQQMNLGQTEEDSQKVSRLTLETLLGTLLGAAIGGNLYLLLSTQKRELWS